VATSTFRFLDKQNTHAEMRRIFDTVKAGKTVDFTEYVIQKSCRHLQPSAEAIPQHPEKGAQSSL
jgi:hypothetical protein